MIGLVGHRKELEAEGKFDECYDNFDTFEPSATFRQGLQKPREHRQEHKRQGEGQGKGQHGNDWHEELALNRLYKNAAHNRSGARKRHKNEG